MSNALFWIEKREKKGKRMIIKSNVVWIEKGKIKK